MNVTEKDRIVGLLEEAGITLNGSNPWDIQIHDERTWNRVFAQGSLGLGEAYMDGWWDAADLAEFFNKVLVGGIADKIRDGRDGILVQPFNSLDAWVSTLQRLAADPGQLRQLRSGIGPVRGSADVAREMAELYSGLASERRASRVLGVS